MNENKTTNKFDEVIKKLAPYFVSTPPLLRTARTLQILLVRQTHDYSIFRTEETRELNVVTLPKAMSDASSILKVAMLASKQKAPENRMYATLTKTLAEDIKVENNKNLLESLADKEEQLFKSWSECSLKDNLCRRCPRCILFGAVSTERGREERWNIKHRIEYSTAYSLEPHEEIYEMLTFNAVTDETQSTGQALGYTENIQPLAHFPSVVTLNSVTREEFIMFLKTLLACKSYGAEGRIKGDVVNYISGIVAGYEEIMTSLEYSLELADRKDQGFVAATCQILQGYQKNAAFSDKVVCLTSEEVKTLVEGISAFSPTQEFLKKLYSDAQTFYRQAEKIAK